MIAMSHATGNANVRAVLAALDEAHLLEVFFTTVGVRGDGALPRALPEKLRRSVTRRSFATKHARLEFHPWKEMLRLAGRETIDSVCFDLDAHVAANCRQQHAGLSAVYCYEDMARETFRLARERGWMTFYDLPIAYWETSQRLLWEEAKRWPDWEPTLVGTRDTREKLARKSEELELADVVLCPSQFVLDSLPAEARAAKRCVVAEFGSPLITTAQETRQDAGGTLRVLFAGSMTQRKGLADLFAAMKLLQRSDVELVVMGAPVAALEFYRQQFAGFQYEPPRPHDEVLKLMRSCDVFVLPSIVEGRALVQQEALACGLPLIVTPNAGGEDLI
ncbi:MAG TPA: glycosyltransferase family 4 protein, partial [Opitutaceae bacterium]|nr:glycosyltransferase family 4 protein [Opitutaceae bacterium]